VGRDEDEGRATLVIAAALGLSVLLLSVAVLVGVLRGERDLAQAGANALAVGFAAAGTALGVQIGKRRRTRD
jgi:hypothetical protein